MTEKMKEKLRYIFDQGWNKRNLEVMIALCAPNFIHHRPPYPDILGADAEKQDIENTFQEYAEIRFDILEIVVEHTSVFMHWTWRATHRGVSPDLPIPPTVKEVWLEGGSLFHLEDGKIIDEWEFADYSGFATQSSTVTSPG